jgi:spermidine synthase
MVGGETLSVYPLDGNWTRFRREYWWRALAAVELPPRPTALLVGLGGGTQVHLLHRRAAPRLITVIERDPAIVWVADEWFGLDAVGPLEILCAAAAVAAPALARARRRFDFIMDDAGYAHEPDPAAALASSLAPLVAPRGTLVVNRHLRGDAPRVAAALRRAFESVRLCHVRPGGENVLICCRGLLRRA